MERGNTSSALWGMEGSDEQSPASMNRDSVAFCVCKQAGVALGLFESHSTSRSNAAENESGVKRLMR